MAVAIAAMTAAAMEAQLMTTVAAVTAAVAEGARRLCLEADHALSWDIHP